MEWMVAHAGDLRLAAFGGVLAFVLLLEVRWPQRPGPMQRRPRWVANLGLVALDTVLVRLLLPLGAIGVALWVERTGTGFLNAVGWPVAVEAVLAFLALDALIYWQHRIFHKVPAFWRLHRVHHSDLEFDATTALRFHPAEILLSMLIKMAAVALLGAPAVAVVVFEIALNGTAMFNHANLRLPPAVDRVLRLMVVTPDMHRVHHSVHRVEHDTNFGFNLPWWDRLFGSYTPQPREGHTGMRIGLQQFRTPDAQGLVALLTQPAQPL
ncbi:MAG: sterol desaturase family protein [Nevskiales bacterium]|nr:sterol desaturase family protein [Nevskiales bacterium]